MPNKNSNKNDCRMGYKSFNAAYSNASIRAQGPQRKVTVLPPSEDQVSQFEELTLRAGPHTQWTVWFSRQIVDQQHSDVPTGLRKPLPGRSELFLCSSRDGEPCIVEPEESETHWFLLDGGKAAKVTWEVKKSECEPGTEIPRSLVDSVYTAGLSGAGEFVCQLDDRAYVPPITSDNSATSFTPSRIKWGDLPVPPKSPHAVETTFDDEAELGVEEGGLSDEAESEVEEEDLSDEAESEVEEGGLSDEDSADQDEGSND